MWTRKELKDKAKVSFRANYWKAVLVALILAALSVGIGGFNSAASSASVPGGASYYESPSYSDGDVNVDISDGRITVDVDGDDGGKVHVTMDADDAEELGGIVSDVIDEASDSDSSSAWVGPGVALFGLSAGLLVLVLIALAVAIYAFVFNPLEIGVQRFFLRNLNQKAEVKEVAFAYDNCYLESVKTLFLRDIFVILWGLLFVIPGIYKSYEYRMIPYLMADDPTIDKDRAFAESKRMMDGQKWNAFVLDLSFLGWNILSVLTLGILGVFYVDPYQAQTNAALYEKLRYGQPAPAQQQPAAYPGAAPVQPGPAQYAQPYDNVAPVPPAGYAAPAYYAQPTQPTQTTQPVQTTQQMQFAQSTQPMQTAEPVQPTTPMAISDAAATDGQDATVPVIVPATEPPVPPFAAVGSEVDREPELEEIEAPAVPEEPETPEVPEVSQEPEAPESPEAPEKPETPNPSEGDERGDSPEA